MPAENFFFSYSRTDAPFVLKLAKDLRAAGLNIWLDQLDIKAGTHWDTAVENALQSSTGVIIVLSPASVASHNVMDEVSFAIEEGKHVIPLMYEACSPPLRLRRLQRIDFTKNYNEGYELLKQQLSGTEKVHETTPLQKKSADEYIPVVETKPVKENSETVQEKEAPALVEYDELFDKNTSKGFLQKNKYVLITAVLAVIIFTLFMIKGGDDKNGQAGNMNSKTNDSIQLSQLKDTPSNTPPSAPAYQQSSIAQNETAQKDESQNGTNPGSSDGETPALQKVEVEAEFPGGLSGWRRFLMANLRAETAANNGAPPGSYNVIVQFIVEKNGSLSNIQALSNFRYGLEDEALRVMRLSPNWIPATQNGRNVRAYRKQPIAFVVEAQ